MKKFIKSNIFFLIILGIIVFAVYGKAINFELTNLDDDTLTIRNIDYISDYRNIPDLFVSGCYFVRQTLYYRPMLNLSFMIESIFFGYNTKVYHTTNILLFILSLFLIFIFVKRLLYIKNEWILKCLVILFAVHPILTSVPVWIPARNDSLLTVFFISSLIFFIDYLNTKKTLYFFLYLFFYAVALFTKEIALPLIIIYPMIWKIRRSDGQKVSNDHIEQQRQKTLDCHARHSLSSDDWLLQSEPTFCATTRNDRQQQKTLSSQHSALNLFFFLAILAGYFFLRHNETVENPEISFYIKNCLLYGKNIVFGIMIYIKQFIFPNYMPIMQYNISLDFLTIIINILFFISLIFVYYKKIIDRKLIFFAVTFFFLAIFPTFMQTEYTLLFHRLIIIIPSVLIIAALLTDKILIKYPIMKKYFILTFILLLPIFVYASFNQEDKYKNSFNFWQEAYNNAPNYHKTPDGLAKEYTKIKNYEKALQLEKDAINLNENILYYINYAVILYNMGDLKNAKQIFLKILNNYKKNDIPYEYLSKIFLTENDFENAIKYAQKAIELSSEQKDILYNNLAWIYSVAGQYEKSIEILENLLKKDKNKAYYKNLSMLYEDIGDHEKAEKMKKAIIK